MNPYVQEPHVEVAGQILQANPAGDIRKVISWQDGCAIFGQSVHRCALGGQAIVFTSQPVFRIARAE
jgi:hypothetical protein